MSAESPPLEPASAYGLFIGASRFKDRKYGDRPSVAASAQALAGLFADSGVWDMPDERRVLVQGEVNARAALDALAEAAEQPVQLLLVYIGCHGSRFFGDPGLKLALSDADFRWYDTHLQFSQVKEILQDSRARLKLLLLDCCYSDDSYLGGQLLDQLPLDVTGVCTLVATELRAEASAKWRRTDYTAFAGALLEVLGEGIPYGPEPLTVQDAFGALEIRLRDKGMPRPGMRGSAGTMPLFRNHHPDAVVPVPQPERVDIVPADPVAYARGVAELDAGPEVTAEGRSRLGDFVQRRELADIATAVRAFVSLDRPELAAAAVSGVCALRDGVEFSALAHLLHQDGLLVHDLLSAALAEAPGRQFTGVVQRLRDNRCEVCGQITDALVAGAASDWSAERLVDVLDGLPLGPDDAAARTAGADGSARGRLLAGLSHERLADVAALLWSADDQEGSGPSPRGRIEAAAIIERAAGWAGPLELFGLAERLTEHGSPELATVLLESAATTAGVRDIADLLRLAGADPGRPQPGGLLLTTLVRRRPPGFLAELLRELRPGDGELADLLLTAAIDGGTVRDISLMLLVLRHAGSSVPETPQAVTELIERLAMDQLAEALVLFDRYGDQGAVDVLLARTRLTDSEAIADLIHRLSELGQPQLVAATVRHAAEDPPAHAVLHLFSLLEERGLADEAADVLHASLGRTEPQALATALELFRSTRRPGAERMARIVRAIVRDCTVEQAYELSLWARNRNSDEEKGLADTVAIAVAALWPVPQIAVLAERFTDRAYQPLANDLFHQAASVFGQLRTNGADIADLVLALRRMPDPKVRRESTQLIRRLAESRDTQQVMVLVSRLLAARKYPEFRETLENALLKHFTWQEFTSLPGVYKATYLPAVLEIEMRALLSPSCVPAERFPSVVHALKDAGTGSDDLKQLLGYVGHKRWLDPSDVILRLRAAGLGPEANSFTDGSGWRRPVFLKN